MEIIERTFSMFRECYSALVYCMDSSLPICAYFQILNRALYVIINFSDSAADNIPGKGQQCR